MHKKRIIPGERCHDGNLCDVTMAHSTLTKELPASIQIERINAPLQCCHPAHGQQGRHVLLQVCWSNSIESSLQANTKVHPAWFQPWR